MGEPQVSVIIPAYNHGQFLVEALNSVLSQTFEGFEVLVVDDGSADDTRQVVERYASRVRYLFKTHTGVSGTRNVGLQHTTGPYIAFLDADDTWMPEKLSRQVAYLESHQEVGVVFTDYITTTEAGEFLAREPRFFPYHRHPFEAMVVWPYGSMQMAMVRRSCLDRVGGFDESLTIAEDWDMWLRVAQHYGIAKIDRPLATYRQTSASASRGPQRREAPAMYRRVLDKLFADPERLPGWTLADVARLRRRAYASLEITIGLMLQGPPWRHIFLAGSLCPSVLIQRRRAVAFLVLHGVARACAGVWSHDIRGCVP